MDIIQRFMIGKQRERQLGYDQDLCTRPLHLDELEASLKHDDQRPRNTTRLALNMVLILLAAGRL
jgi:hypothetical protein